MRAALTPVFPLAAILLLSSCGFFFGGDRTTSDPAETTYRNAMETFSNCATARDPVSRSRAAAQLSNAANMMAADTRPTNPDHFFMLDRVRAAQAYCSDAAAF